MPISLTSFCGIASRYFFCSVQSAQENPKVFPMLTVVESTSVFRHIKNVVRFNIGWMFLSVLVCFISFVCLNIRCISFVFSRLVFVSFNIIICFLV